MLGRIIAKWIRLTGESVRLLTMNITLLVMRVCAGGFMLYGHGYGKLTKLLSGETEKFPDPLGIGSTPSFILATLAEFFGAALVIVGLATRLALAMLIVTMAVAAFVYHAEDPFGKKELALLYLTVFVSLILSGPGRYSLDGMIVKKIEKSGKK